MLSLNSYNIKKIESNNMDNELIEEVHIIKTTARERSESTSTL